MDKLGTQIVSIVERLSTLGGSCYYLFIDFLARSLHVRVLILVLYPQPERIDQSIGKKGYDVRADVWSLGVSLVELATGSLPYDCSKFTTDFEFLTHIVGAPPPLPDKEGFSPLFFNFISQW